MPTARGPAMTGSRCASSERPCVPSEDRVCPGWEPGRPGFMTDSTRTGDRAGKTRDQLIMEYAPLVRGIARRYVGRGFGFEDVCQSGYLGLIQAVDRFDASRGVPLERYAARMVEGEIMHLFRDRGWSVRVPRSLQELSRRVGPVGVGSGWVGGGGGGGCVWGSGCGGGVRMVSGGLRLGLRVGC